MTGIETLIDRKRAESAYDHFKKGADPQHLMRRVLFWRRATLLLFVWSVIQAAYIAWG